MNQNFIPKLSKSDKIWLKEVIKAYFNREKIDFISLSIQLSDKLSNDFDHTKIDYSLIKSDNVPTLFSIWLLDSKNPIINLADNVLKLIKKLIKTDPLIRRFKKGELSSALNYIGKDMDLCLELIYSMGLFFNSAGSSEKNSGFSYVEVSSVDYIKNILSYKDLESTFEKKKIVQTNPISEKISNKLKTPETKSKILSGTAFIIMRMDKDYKEGPEICKTIKDVCNSFGIIAIRADDEEHSDIITELILKKIKTSEFLIADLSGEKPNVYYEVGYAHAIKRKPILYRASGTKLHFDLSVHNVPEYEDCNDLRRQLTNRFTEIKKIKA